MELLGENERFIIYLEYPNSRRCSLTPDLNFRMDHRRLCKLEERR